LLSISGISRNTRIIYIHRPTVLSKRTQCVLRDTLVYTLYLSVIIMITQSWAAAVRRTSSFHKRRMIDVRPGGFERQQQRWRRRGRSTFCARHDNNIGSHYRNGSGTGNERIIIFIYIFMHVDDEGVLCYACGATDGKWIRTGSNENIRTTRLKLSS